MDTALSPSMTLMLAAVVPGVQLKLQVAWTPGTRCGPQALARLQSPPVALKVTLARVPPAAAARVKAPPVGDTSSGSAVRVRLMPHASVLGGCSSPVWAMDLSMRGGRGRRACEVCVCKAEVVQASLSHSLTTAADTPTPLTSSSAWCACRRGL